MATILGFLLCTLQSLKVQRRFNQLKHPRSTHHTLSLESLAIILIENNLFIFALPVLPALATPIGNKGSHKPSSPSRRQEVILVLESSKVYEHNKVNQRLLGKKGL